MYYEIEGKKNTKLKKWNIKSLIIERRYFPKKNYIDKTVLNSMHWSNIVTDTGRHNASARR